MQIAQPGKRSVYAGWQIRKVQWSTFYPYEIQKFFLKGKNLPSNCTKQMFVCLSNTRSVNMHSGESYLKELAQSILSRCSDCARGGEVCLASIQSITASRWMVYTLRNPSVQVTKNC